MARPTSTQRGRALQAAQGTLDQLGLDLTRPVDVFGALSRLDLDISFQRLDNLLGAIVPGGGVLISTQRPATVQRYTAAHEIGHWVLDQEQLVLDSEREINGDVEVEREQLAQLFASYFLMPPPLIRGTAARHHVRKGTQPDPAQVYLIARDVRASYEAVVRHLHNLDFYEWAHLRRLLQVTPLAAKSAAAFGQRPVNGNCDVWPLTLPEDGTELQISVDDELIFALPESASTGYRWLTPDQNDARRTRQPQPEPPPFGAPPVAQPSTEGDGGNAEAGVIQKPLSGAAVKRALALLPVAVNAATPSEPEGNQPFSIASDAYRASWTDANPREAATIRRALAGDRTSRERADVNALQQLDQGPPIGGTGTRILGLRAAEEGTHSLTLTLVSPYEAETDPAMTLTVTATAAPSPAVNHRRQLIAETDLDERLPGDPADEDIYEVTGNPA